MVRVRITIGVRFRVSFRDRYGRLPIGAAICKFPHRWDSIGNYADNVSFRTARYLFTSYPVSHTRTNYYWRHTIVLIDNILIFSLFWQCLNGSMREYRAHNPDVVGSSPLSGDFFLIFFSRTFSGAVFSYIFGCGFSRTSSGSVFLVHLRRFG